MEADGLIDVICGEPHFADHARPIWKAIGGRLVVGAGEAEPSGNPALVASHGDLREARRLGAPRIAYLEHGAGQSYGGEPHRERYGNKWCPHCHPSYAGGADHDDVELFLVPGPHPAARWAKAYPRARVEVVGCPKLDTLPAGRPATPVVALSFHFNAGIGSAEADSLFRFYRTRIHELAKRFTLIGHAHPRWANRVRPWFDRWHVPFVASFEDICRQAAVYVCDNSSTLFEFAATGRPVVVLDGPLYRRGIEHGLRFWAASHVGIHAKPETLLNAIGRALEDPEPDAREDALSLVYAHRAGAAARAAAAIADWLEAA